MTRAHSPADLDQALELLRVEPDLVPVAGCTDLMVAEPEWRADLPGVIDLLGISELRGIEARGDGLEIGATTTFTELRRSSYVRSGYPALAEAAGVIGGWQIQNRATIGGNIVNASPAGDSLPVLLALDATVVAVSRSGRREIPYRDFHVGYRQTALEPGELLAWIRLPAPPGLQLFRKVGTREAQAISKIVVAMAASLVEGVFESCAIGVGSVAATPVRLPAVEEALVGRAPSEESAELAGRLAAESVEPIDDVRSTAGYRSFALSRVIRRMILQQA